jgi:hypothetical protein
MKSSAELEREGDATRASINETLDELRARITPGQVLDQLVEYGRATSGGTLVRNLRRQVVDNPLPVVLVGVGVAWLMMANGRSSRADGNRAVRGIDDATDSLRAAESRATEGASSALASTRSAASRSADAVSSAASRSAEAASSAADSVRSAASRSAEAASSLIDSVRARASDTYGSASSAARRAAATVADSAAAVRSRSLDLLDALREQPLALAGLGVTIGAVLGATLPTTETEDRLVGDASDELKESMRRVAEKTKQTARSAYDQATEPMRSAAAEESAASTVEERPQPATTGTGSSVSEGGRCEPLSAHKATR